MPSIAPRPALAAALAAALALGASAGAPLAAQSPATPSPIPPVADAPAVALAGVVWDSVAARPLGGAVVQVSDLARPERALSATTDSLGRWRVDGLAPGRYLVGFLHETVDVLGLLPPSVVAVVGSDSLARLDLATPGIARLRAATCGAAAEDSTALLVGLVRDAERGVAAAGAEVVLSWPELALGGGATRLERRTTAVPVDGNGRFVACGLPTDADVAAVARAPGLTSGTVDLTPTPAGVYRRDIMLGRADSSARRSAALHGVVRRADGRPLGGARVIVHDTRAGVTTRDDGTFTLDALPSGTHTVEARAIGLLPRRVSADLAPDRPARVELVLDERVPTLERVTVKGTRTRTLRDARYEEFLERRSRGFGYFLTAAQIENRPGNSMTDMLRIVPGLRMEPATDGSMRWFVRGRGNCVPDVFIDGFAMIAGDEDLDFLVSPRDILGVETYMGVATVPPRYMRYGNTCGVVLIWTK